MVNVKVNHAESTMGFLRRNETALKSVLPPSVSFERLMLIVESAVRANEELAQCNKVSLVGAVLQCCFLGLEPNDGRQLISLVPFKGVVKAMLEYKGMIELATRSGAVSMIKADVAYHHDFVRHKVTTIGGTLEIFEHESNLDVPRTRKPDDIKLAYAVARLTDGSYKVEYLTTREIREVHEKKTDIWRIHWSEMAKKTAIRRLYKTLPKTPEVLRHLELEDDPDYDPAKLINELLPLAEKENAKEITLKEELENAADAIYAAN